MKTFTRRSSRRADGTAVAATSKDCDPAQGSADCQTDPLAAVTGRDTAAPAEHRLPADVGRRPPAKQNSAGSPEASPAKRYKAAPGTTAITATAAAAAAASSPAVAIKAPSAAQGKKQGDSSAGLTAAAAAAAASSGRGRGSDTDIKAAGAARTGSAASGGTRAVSGSLKAAGSGTEASNTKAANSGAGPAGSGCGKRSRGSSPTAQAGGRACTAPSQSSKAGKPRGSTHQQNTAAAAAAAGQGTGGPSGRRNSSPAPVSLLTPRRPSRLVPVGLLAAAEVRPAQTVMEAQERGELVQLQDDARYAMDGLSASCGIDTQRESAVVLTDMLCSRKGRLALRTDGLAQQVLSSLAKLKPSKDCVLGLAATVVLLMLTSEDAHPTYLASVAAAVLVDQLLQCNPGFEEVAACCPSGARLVRLLKARPLCSLLSSTGVTTQRELLLVTLEQATSSQQASKVAAVERLKGNLRRYGALDRLGKLVALTAADAALSARQLHLMLLVLENATFTCPENGQVLVNLRVEQGGSKAPVAAAAGNSGPSGEKQPFPALLVQAAQQLLTALDQPECSQALHVCMSVLMNLSHQNLAGAAAISSAGGLDAAAATISLLLQPVQDKQQALCRKVLQHLELISVALGVLINLVSSGDAANSRRLAAIVYNPGNAAVASSAVSSQGSTAAEEGVHEALIVHLLCTVMSTLGLLLQQEETAAAGADEVPEAAQVEGMPRLPAAAATARTVDSETALTPGSSVGLAGDDEGAGEASIVEVYCGMLLGFLVRDCPDLAASVARRLPGESLQPLVCAVQRCLSFYVSTGAITDHTRITLEELLRHLEAACADC